MDILERFNETTATYKKVFYSKLYQEDNIDDHYKHAQKVFKKFEIKNLGEYHDLHVQSDTSLPVNIFENFRIK